MTTVRRLVIDVLKPHDPPLVEFTRRVSDVESVEGVTSALIELDQEVQNVKLTFEGAGLEYDAIEETVERLGATVHSVDEVACGEHVVENRPTPQDG
jgi:hypothetical protein